MESSTDMAVNDQSVSLSSMDSPSPKRSVPGPTMSGIPFAFISRKLFVVWLDIAAVAIAEVLEDDPGTIAGTEGIEADVFDAPCWAGTLGEGLKRLCR